MSGYRQGVNTDGELLRDFYVEHDPVDLDCSDSLDYTRQEFKAECDINVLLDRYERTGVIDHVNRGTPVYMDLSEGVPDLMTAMQVLQDATTAFMTLPAKVRREFDNDAVKFVAFAEDPANLGQMREWGLAEPEKVTQAPIQPGQPLPKEMPPVLPEELGRS